MSYSKSFIFALLFILIYSVSTHAVLPPKQSIKRKINLMESALKARNSCKQIYFFRVLSSRFKDKRPDNCNIHESHTIKAKITKVVKGDKKQGDIISIKYGVNRFECPGPKRYHPKTLYKRADYKGFLKKNGRSFSPGAGAWSFHGDEEFSKELNRAYKRLESLKNKRLL